MVLLTQSSVRSGFTVFRIQSLNTRQLNWLIRHSNIPIIGCVGETSNGLLGSLQLDESTLSLSTYTRPLKVLLLNADGGITDHTGQVGACCMCAQVSQITLYSILSIPYIVYYVYFV